ncbi:MAG: gluconeogenesis factor YvcK family protein [Microgenomates group bacterium]
MNSKQNVGKELNIVVMGGGTGTFCVITALKQLNVNITSIIAVSDSGGSTGRIRDEFGFQPVGDLRQSLAAMADPNGQEWIKKILLYRFSKGSGLKGHNLGNLILTALQDMTQDTTAALEIAEKVFNLKGTVIPVTTQTVDLKIVYADGSSVLGEHILDEVSAEYKKIDHVTLVPDCALNPRAAEAIGEADLVVIGPGDYYASLMATLVVNNLKGTFAKSSAKIVHIVNLMTRRTQTHGMSAKNHVDGIENAIGKPLDFTVVNSSEIPTETLRLYKKANEFPVVDDLGADESIHRADLLSEDLIQKPQNDSSYRSLLRHDPSKLKIVLEKILMKL